MIEPKLHVRLTEEQADLVVRLCREVSWGGVAKARSVIEAVEDARKPKMVNL
jgi:hypothetical protein